MSKRLGYFFSKGTITSRGLKTMMFLFVQPFLVMKFVAIFTQKNLLVSNSLPNYLFWRDQMYTTCVVTLVHVLFRGLVHCLSWLFC